MSSPQQRPQQSAVAKQFVTVAVVATVALLALLVLWLTDVIPFGVFIAGIAVVGVVELAVIVNGQRRRSQQAAREQRLPGGTSTLDANSPHTRYGYDPTDDLNGPGGR